MVDKGVTSDIAERLATEINQLQFSVWKLEDSSLVQVLCPALPCPALPCPALIQLTPGAVQAQAVSCL